MVPQATFDKIMNQDLKKLLIDITPTSTKENNPLNKKLKSIL